MRTPYDALRSMHRYAFQALGDEWEVRLEGAQGTFKRPFCRVKFNTPGTIRPMGQWHKEYRRTFGILCYPALKDTEEDAQLEAVRVESLLDVALSAGIDEASFDAARNRRHPNRIPLYDWTGIAMNEDVVEVGNPGADRAKNDFIHVSDPVTVDSVPDPDNDYAFVVVAEVRGYWMQSMAIPSSGVPAVTVGANPTPG